MISVINYNGNGGGSSSGSGSINRDGSYSGNGRFAVGIGFGDRAIFRRFFHIHLYKHCIRRLQRTARKQTNVGGDDE